MKYLKNGIGAVANLDLRHAPILGLSTTFLLYSHYECLFYEKMPNFLKMQTAYNFASVNCLDHPRAMYNGKETPVKSFWFF